MEGLCDLVDEMKREHTVHMQLARFGCCCSGNVRLCFACRGSHAYLRTLLLVQILVGNAVGESEAMARRRYAEWYALVL